MCAGVDLDGEVVDGDAPVSGVKLLSGNRFLAFGTGDPHPGGTMIVDASGRG